MNWAFRVIILVSVMLVSSKTARALSEVVMPGQFVSCEVVPRVEDPAQLQVTMQFHVNLPGKWQFGYRGQATIADEDPYEWFVVDATGPGDVVREWHIQCPENGYHFTEIFVRFDPAPSALSQSSKVVRETSYDLFLDVRNGQLFKCDQEDPEPQYEQVSAPVPRTLPPATVTYPIMVNVTGRVEYGWDHCANEAYGVPGVSVILNWDIDNDPNTIEFLSLFPPTTTDGDGFFQFSGSFQSPWSSSDSMDTKLRV